MIRDILCFVLLGFLCVLSSQADSKPFQDFFRRKLVKEKPVIKVTEERVKVVKRDPVIPPLQISILGIAGEEGSRLGIINFKGRQALIAEGDQRKEYKVIRIEEDKITVLHKKAKRRQEISF